MEASKDKLEAVLNDARLLPKQRQLIGQWAKHLGTFKTPECILEQAYTLREFGLFLKKPIEEATPNDVKAYLAFKGDSKKSITGKRVKAINADSLKTYWQRLKAFYRFILKHTEITIDNGLAYPAPNLVKKQEFSREQICERRVKALLNNKTAGTLSAVNLKTLDDFHNYKIASGKVESYTGFVGKLFFLKRLGLFLHDQTYKGATREEI
ncbi:MAG: hypothetical protein ABIB71_09295, partial [Candidatus Woesearchaeota archaeon]